MPSMEPGLCFSNHPPTENIAIYLSQPVPPATFIEGLHTAARKAILDGKLSIVDRTYKNSTSFFLFELIEFWATLTKAINAKQVWVAAKKWLEQAGEDKRLDQEVRGVHVILQTTPWSGHIQILHSRVTFLEMATFLSDGWLSSSQVDMALSSTTLRLCQCSDGKAHSRYLIGTTILSEYLHSSPLLHKKSSSHDHLPSQDYKSCAPQELQHAGDHLVQYKPDGEVLCIAFSPPGHWAAVSVTSWGTLEWADSLDRRPHGPSLNEIKHRVFGDMLWHEEDHTRLHIREFLDIMHGCQKFEGKSEHTSLSLGTAECPLGDADFKSPLLSIDFSSPCSYDAEVQALPFPPKRAHIQPPPNPQPSLCTILKSKDAPKPLNQLSKTVANKRELNKAIEAGTFKRNQCKWAKFKMKISEIDPLSEVDDDNPKRVRDVLHIKCGKVIRMATAYDVSLFKHHVQSCKSQTARAGMHTLDRGLSFVFLQCDGSPSLANSSARDDLTSMWPCPGLSGDTDPQIENYSLRTTVPSAGGTSIENVAHNMYKRAYKDLTRDEKQAVHNGKMHMHRWSLEHQQRCIFAIGIKPCLRTVPHNANSNTRSPQPCEACSSLLRDHAFRTAISRIIPEDENRKFTPHLYQATEIVKIHAKHSGLGSIFDKDAPNNQLLL
ncbi:hypothetical protein V8E53_011848 [Lactarius tabidus]